MNTHFKIKHFAKGITTRFSTWGERSQQWMGTFLAPDIQKLCSIAHDQDITQVNDVVQARMRSFEGKKPVDEMIHMFVGMYLQNDILVKVDRASMMHGLEVRSPFLDKDYAQFVASLPVNYKMRKGQRKWLYKKALGKMLPKSIIERKKKGFGLPTAKWLAHVLREQMLFILHDSAFARSGVCDMSLLRKMYARHCDLKEDMRKELWNIFMLGLWWEEHV